jgi:hypothetical protein
VRFYHEMYNHPLEHVLRTCMMNVSELLILSLPNTLAISHS